MSFHSEAYAPLAFGDACVDRGSRLLNFVSAPLTLWRYLRRRAETRRDFAYLGHRTFADIGLNHGQALAAANGIAPTRAEAANHNVKRLLCQVS